MTHSQMNSLHPGYIISLNICPPSCRSLQDTACLVLGWWRAAFYGGCGHNSKILFTYETLPMGPLNTSSELHVTFGFAHDLPVVPSQHQRFGSGCVHCEASGSPHVRFSHHIGSFPSFSFSWVFVTSLIFRFLKNKENKTNHSHISRPQHLVATCNLGCLGEKKCFDHFQNQTENVSLGISMLKVFFFLFLFKNILQPGFYRVFLSLSPTLQICLTEFLVKMSFSFLQEGFLKNLYINLQCCEQHKEEMSQKSALVFERVSHGPWLTRGIYC